MISKLKEVRDNQGFMKYFRNTSWLFLEKILRIAVGLFISIWIARYLGPSQFGLFSYVQSFVGMFTIIAGLGLHEVLVREFVNGQLNETRLILTAFWMRIFAFIFIILLLIITLTFISNDTYTNNLIFITISASAFSSFSVIDFYFQSKVVSKYTVYSTTIALAISSILKVILILNQAPLVAFVWIIPLETFIWASVLLFYYRRYKSKNRTFNIWIFDKNIAFTLLKYSWSLIFSSIVIAIYMKIDQVMIKEMLNVTATGQYAAAVKLSEGWYFIPAIIATSFFPAILNAKKQSQESYYFRLKKLYSIMVVTAIIIVLIVSLSSDWIINLLYGVEYSQASDVLKIHIFSSIFIFLGFISGKWLITENLQIYSMINTTLGMFLNILLNYIFIDSYGIIGAAWATVITVLCSEYLFLSLFKKTRINFVLLTKSLLLYEIWRVKK